MQFIIKELNIEYLKHSKALINSDIKKRTIYIKNIFRY